MNISEKVFEIVRKNVSMNAEKSNSICLTSRLTDDLGMDSLSTVEAVMALEDAFSIQIAEDDANSFSTVEDVILYVTSKVQEDKTLQEDKTSVDA